MSNVRLFRLPVGTFEFGEGTPLVWGMLMVRPCSGHFTLQALLNHPYPAISFNRACSVKCGDGWGLQCGRQSRDG